MHARPKSLRHGALLPPAKVKRDDLKLPREFLLEPVDHGLRRRSRRSPVRVDEDERRHAALVGGHVAQTLECILSRPGTRCAEDRGDHHGGYECPAHVPSSMSSGKSASVLPSSAPIRRNSRPNRVVRSAMPAISVRSGETLAHRRRRGT